MLDSPVLLRAPEVMRRCGISRSLLFDLIGRKQFPSPIRITARNVGFIEAEVTAWINNRVAETRGAEPEDY